MQVYIESIKPQELNSFFDLFDFSNDSKHVQENISFIHELSICYQTIIYKVYSSLDNEMIGFTSLRSTWGDVEGVPGVYIEFIYLKSKYRNKIDLDSKTKYSFLLLDCIMKIAIDVQEKIALNHVYLVPINEKIRTIYEDYGFVSIPDDKKIKYEDIMVFNLLDEDSITL